MIKKYIVSIANIDNPKHVKDTTVYAENVMEAVYKTEKTTINPYREKVIASYPFQFSTNEV